MHVQEGLLAHLKLEWPNEQAFRRKYQRLKRT